MGKEVSSSYIVRKEFGKEESLRMHLVLNVYSDRGQWKAKTIGTKQEEKNSL